MNIRKTNHKFVDRVNKIWYHKIVREERKDFMDNKINFLKCEACNTLNMPKSVFCKGCGKKLEKKAPEEKMVCEECRLEYSKKVKFCGNCGKPLTEKVKKPEEKKLTKQDFCNSVIYKRVKSGIILFLSFILLIAAFTSLYSYEIDDKYIDNLEYPFDVEYSAIDNIVFLFDSMVDSDEEEIQYDSLYEELEDLKIELKEIDFEKDYVYLSTSEEEVLIDYIKTTVRLNLRSDSVELSPRFIVLAIVSLLYVAFALVFFGISLYQFIKTLMNKETSKKKIISLLCLAPFVLAIAYLVSAGGSAETSFCAGGTMFLLISGLELLVAERFIFSQSKLDIKKTVISALCLTFAVVVMFLAFSSAFSVEIRGQFKESEIKRSAETYLDASYFQNLELSDKALDSYEETSTNAQISTIISTIIYQYRVTEVREGDADRVISSLVTYTMYRWMNEYSVIFCITYYVAVIAAVLSALLAWRILYSICTEETKKKSVTLYSIFALAASVLYLTMNIMFVIMGNMMSEIAETEKIFSFSIAGETIFTVIFAILGLVAAILHTKNKDANTAVEEPETVAEVKEEQAEPTVAEEIPVTTEA